MTFEFGKPIKVDPTSATRGRKRTGTVADRLAQLILARKDRDNAYPISICKSAESARNLASVIKCAGVTPGGKKNAHYVPPRTQGDWVTGALPHPDLNPEGHPKKEWLVWAQYAPEEPVDDQ